MDLDNIIGGDIGVTSPIAGTADINTVVNPVEGQQRVLRRLLTNPGAYLWQPTYGAGLSRYIGQAMNETSISGTIKQQMKLEQAVVQSPPPNVRITYSKSGEVVASIQYLDASTNLTSSLAVPISEIIVGD